MMTQLKLIQETAQHVVSAIAASLGVDVAMIDTRFELIATSATFLEKRGTDINQSFIVNGVYEKGTMVLPNPGHNALCAGCRYQGNCPETAEVLRTIRYEGEIIGVILMVTYTQAQKEKLLGNTAALLEFIGEMAKLICNEIKLQETIEKEKIVRRQLETTINFVNNGIIAIDREGRVTQINKRSLEILGIGRRSPKGMTIQDVLPRYVFDLLIGQGQTIKRMEIDVVSPIRTHCILSGNPLTVQSKIMGAVISMEDIQEVRSTVYEFGENLIQYTFDDIRGDSEEMERIKDYASQIALNHSTILIQGESGTGKELFARAIHGRSERAGRPFIPINCAAIPETLLESELFGYDEGAFSGARKGGKPGKFEMASGGTLFLDEIGDMPLHMQAKLLRVLQEGEIERLGGMRTIAVDVRVIAATNQDLEQMVKVNGFRKDLFFRLNVLPLKIPPLRSRRSDIRILADFFLDKHNRKIGKSIQGFSGEARGRLLAYYWPGNVRELENTVEYAVNVEDGPVIGPGALPVGIAGRSGMNAENQMLAGKLKDYERLILREALESHGNTVQGKKGAAKELGISLPTLYRKCKELAV